MPKFFKRKPIAIWADILTLTRGIAISAALLMLAIFKVKSYQTLLALVLAGWITDWYDGAMARKANQPSRIGENEVSFDLLMIMAASIYLLAIFPVPWFLFAPLLIWLILCILAFYGRFRHKKKSFIWGIESGARTIIGAPAITAALLAYGIYQGGGARTMAISFLVAGIFHIPIGLRARRRLARAVATLDEDIKKATERK